jgi:hypothetical protein
MKKIGRKFISLTVVLAMVISSLPRLTVSVKADTLGSSIFTSKANPIQDGGATTYLNTAILMVMEMMTSWAIMERMLMISIETMGRVVLQK